ncbi:hypothetical protein E0H73_42810 [Kribbella pittospori]|uniref:Uncharacterized protein n=1 Tax=Kribbella pittospori TaxID=722689 RepID=A0A4R0JMV2_9ACTN|nr:hypothetical protein [Kribbella pittospori]TCC48541.1 hypothetical protein E0H73_42810 [Kribbella pittospori]
MVYDDSTPMSAETVDGGAFGMLSCQGKRTVQGKDGSLDALSFPPRRPFMSDRELKDDRELKIDREL